MKNFIDYDIWTTQGVEKPGVMIILDPGHGGFWQGKYATAPSKMFDFGDFVYYEGVENRKIAVQLAHKFKENNIAHAFTTTSNAIDESLKDRITKIANIKSAYPKYHHVVLSLHANASSSPEANGIEFYTSPDITDSDYAANLYFPYLYDMGLKVRVNRAKALEFDKEASFYVLRKSEALGCIAMLFEMGFFTNREEALKMMEQEWQLTYVNALYKGTRDLIEKIKKDGTVR